MSAATESRDAPAGQPEDELDDEVWAQFEAAQPVMTLADAEKASENLLGLSAGRTIRAGLLVLTKSGAELLQGVRGEPEAAEAMAKLADLLEHRVAVLRDATAALDAAALRVRLALCAVPEATP